MILFLFACSVLMDGKSESSDTSEAVLATEQSAGESERVVGITLAHNLVRQQYGVPDLIYDQELAQVSVEWIEHLAQNGCVLEHNWDSPLGENLFWSNYEASPEVVVESWASEVVYYDYETNSCEPGQMCGHFTQLVWSTTERVGCAVGVCTDGSEIWMCNYDPAGNMVGVLPY